MACCTGFSCSNGSHIVAGINGTVVSIKLLPVFSHCYYSCCYRLRCYCYNAVHVSIGCGCSPSSLIPFLLLFRCFTPVAKQCNIVANSTYVDLFFSSFSSVSLYFPLRGIQHATKLSVMKTVLLMMYTLDVQRSTKLICAIFLFICK